jgi:hypothetical protein
MPGRLDRLLGAEPRRPRRLPCCSPYRAAFPSGRAWAHSRYCETDRRGQKLDAEELAQIGAAPPPAQHRVLTPAQADRLRPVGHTALLCWLSHPTGCECYGCHYTSEHLDDDNRRLEP